MIKKYKWNYKKIFKELVISVMILFVISNIVSYFRKPILESDILPFFVEKTIVNNEIDMKNYSGKPLLVHFWATWCPTCRLENSNIEAISKKYNVITIAVNSGDNEVLRAYMKKNNFTFDVLNDNTGKIAKSFHIEAYPTTFIYNSYGKLKFTEVGYTTTAGILARIALVK